MASLLTISSCIKATGIITQNPSYFTLPIFAPSPQQPTQPKHMNELMLPKLATYENSPNPNSSSLSFIVSSSTSYAPKNDELFESSMASVTDFSTLNVTQGKMQERSALQVSCQSKFDTSRRKLNQINIALKSNSNDKAKKGQLLRQSKQLQIYSTLLYMSLMMHKVEEVRVLWYFCVVKWYVVEWWCDARVASEIALEPPPSHLFYHNWMNA